MKVLLLAEKKVPVMFLIDHVLNFIGFLNTHALIFPLHFASPKYHFNHFAILNFLARVVPDYLNLALQDSNQRLPQMFIKEA
mgnify:CR=1 FL=1